MFLLPLLTKKQKRKPMEDYHFHCFQASWETKPFLKAGLPVHGGASHTLTVSVSSSHWPRHSPHDNDTTVGERGHHFLDACGRCGRLLGRNKDIVMYRGDPFCSEECRQREMDADEAKERRRSSKQQPAAAAKRGRKQQRQSSSDAQTIQVWALSIVS